MPLSLDAFSQASQPARMQCSVAKIIGALDAADVAVLVAALADSDVKNSAIAAVLTSEGHRISGGTVGRHRKHECACGG